MSDSLARSALSVLLGLTLASCHVGLHSGPTTALSGSGGRWVFLIYMAADNDLERQAIEDINEMEAAGIRGTEITVLALIDRGPGFDSSNGDWTDTRLYEIADDPDGLDTEINSLPLALPALGIDPGGSAVELNMGDPETLAAALSFVADRYQPDHLGLIIWGHGSGYRNGGAESGRVSEGSRAVSFDDSSGGDALLTTELGGAIATAGVRLIGFDVCFGASIEVAYQLRDAASVMVASQDEIPADGWEYDDLLNRIGATDLGPQNVAQAIVESFSETASGFAAGSISAIDLGKIEESVSALDGLARAVYDSIEVDAQRRAVRDSLFYDVEDFYVTPGDLNIDLYDLARIIARDYDSADQEAAGLQNSVKETVFAEWSNTGNPEAHGLSIHLIPLSGDGTALPTHHESYFRDESVPGSLDFVTDTFWPAAKTAETGLLYRLFYEVM